MFRKEIEMTRRLVMTFCVFVFVFMASGCAEKRAYFGVPNRAITAPGAFAETERAINEAERSPGAAYCPEKLEQARKLAQDGVATYWACRDAEAFDKLAKARALAKEATQCQPPPPPPPPPAARPAPPPPPPAVRLPDAVVISRAFNFDSLQLSPAANAMLDRQAEVMRNSPDLRMQIIGHTDSVGTEAYNNSLGRRRALSAKTYLERKGIASQRMEVISRGESQPIATNDTEEGRATNRRIEIRYVR
jgi:outer membrane protein OmpA-like peptidoglycan-associated protein